MIGLNKIGLNQVQLNQLYLNTLCACQKSSGGDGFPHLRGDVTRWSFKGLTNEQMSKNPRLEDADHKGRFLTFKNFAWGGMSGVGGYVENYSIWTKSAVRADITFTDHSFNVTSVKINQVQFYYQSFGGEQPFTVPSCTVIVKGLTDGQVLEYIYTDIEGRHVFTVKNDGIYTLPSFEFIAKGTSYYGFRFNKVQESCNITLEQLPLYPGALVFDGVDDYGICENFPILTKEKGYTVVALRQIISTKASSVVSKFNASNDGAFLFEGYNLAGEYISGSFGTFVHDIEKSPFSYMTSVSYNGTSINPGNKLDKSNMLAVGTFYNDVFNHYFGNIALWELIILDHDATEEELTKIKNYFVKTYPWLFFDQAWTVVGKSNEDTDRATIANITGNGNNLVLSNFGFAGNSGYGEYAYNWNTWKINKVDSTKSNIYHNRMEITLPAIGESSRTQCNFYSPLYEVGTIYDFSFKISGLTGNSVILVRPGTNGGGAIIAQYNKDGVYHLNYTLTDEAIIGESTQNRIYFFIQNFSDEEMNLTIEQIPDHEGYLVTDGVDDYVRSSNDFTLGKKFTVVGEWELLDNTTVLSGIAKNVDFFLYSNINGLSFYCKQGNLPTVFNGIKSLTAFNSEGLAYDHKWEKYVCEKTGDEAPKTTRFIIGTNNNTFAKVAFKNMAMYAEKVLSKEDMIKAYIYLQTLKAK